MQSDLTKISLLGFSHLCFGHHQCFQGGRASTFFLACKHVSQLQVELVASTELVGLIIEPIQSTMQIRDTVISSETAKYTDLIFWDEATVPGNNHLSNVLYCTTMSISKVWIRGGAGLICDRSNGVSIMQHGHLTP
ncbi:hypothetical protein EMCRGX_G025146 [Ephydatia muelleri]